MSNLVFEISQIAQFAHKSVIYLIYEIACTLLTCYWCQHLQTNYCTGEIRFHE